MAQVSARGVAPRRRLLEAAAADLGARGGTELAAGEARAIAREIELAARSLARGQRSGALPADLDPGLTGAMVLGGIRQALGAVLSRPEPPPPAVGAEALWRVAPAAVRCAPAGARRAPA